MTFFCRLLLYITVISKQLLLLLVMKTYSSSYQHRYSDMSDLKRPSHGWLTVSQIIQLIKSGTSHVLTALRPRYGWFC